METQAFKYEFYVLNTTEINAFAVPGGKVFFNSGLIELVENEDEIAGVMAHEIGMWWPGILPGNRSRG